MQLSRIVDALARYYHYNEISEQSVTAKTDIRSCRLVRPKQNIYVSDCLYLGLRSELPPISRINTYDEKPLTFFLANDCEKDIPRKLNVVLLQGNCVLPVLMSNVNTILSDEERFLELSSKELDALHTNKSLQEIVDIAADTVGNTILINDSAFDIIASSYQTEQTKQLLAPDVENNFLQDNVVSNMRSNRILSAIRQDKQTLETIHPVTKANWLFRSARVNGIPAADIAEIADAHPFEYLDFQAIELLAKIVAIKIQQTEPLRLNAGSSSAFFIQSLLTGTLKDAGIIRQRAKSLRIKLHDSLIITVAKPTTAGSDPMGAEYLSTRLRQMLPDGNWIVMKGLVAGLFAGEKPDRLEIRIVERLSTFAGEHNVAVGLSDVYGDPAHSARHFSQAIHACETVPTDGKTYGLRFFSDVFTDYVIDVLREHDGDSTLMHPALIKLAEYDQAHGTDLVKTLKVYLRSMQNTGIASQNLHIHRNSLLYRLGRITEITGMKFDDGNELLRLLLNFRMLENPPRLG